MTETAPPPGRKVGVAAAYVQSVPTGALKGRRGRLCATCKHPGHPDRSGWLVSLHQKPIMNLSKTLILLLVGIMGPVLGAEMSAEWHQEKEQSWQQARSQYPESAHPGPFKDRMVEIDEWARVNDPTLHLNSNKPLILAQMVQREIDELAAAQRNTSNRQQAATSSSPAPPASVPQQVAAQDPSSGDAKRGGLTGSALATIWLGVTIIVALTFGAAWALHWIIRPRHGATTAAALGRKWAAWIVAIATISMLPSFFRRLDADSFVRWAICVVGLGFPAFFIGWLIGLIKFRQRDGRSDSPCMHSDQSPQAPVDNAISESNVGRVCNDQSVLEAMCFQPSREESPNSPTQPTMNNNEFEVAIPEGAKLENGYVEMRHNTQYSLHLKNHRSVPCDAEVTIDGIHVGTWRIHPSNEIRIERPVHDTGHFTFFEVGTSEARAADILKKSINGLISVTFKPAKEERYSTLRTADLPSAQYTSGATGLTGESAQRFCDATAIDHDETRFFTIHLRLVSRRPDIRPLAPRSTPVPPPVD